MAVLADEVQRCLAVGQLRIVANTVRLLVPGLGIRADRTHCSDLLCAGSVSVVGLGQYIGRDRVRLHGVYGHSQSGASNSLELEAEPDETHFRLLCRAYLDLEVSTRSQNFGHFRCLTA